MADVNPMTYALDAWRGTTLLGAGPEVAGELSVLAAVAVVVVGPLSWWVLRRAIDVARRDGTLVTY